MSTHARAFAMRICLINLFPSTMKKHLFFSATFFAFALPFCGKSNAANAPAAAVKAPSVAARASRPAIRIGIGTGPSIPWKLERAAPPAALNFDGSKTSWVDVPDVTLRADGDWSVFLVTRSTDGRNYSA